MQRDFFLMAATPEVKVFLMLEARRRESWDAPSSPAMDPESAAAPAGRDRNRERMFFLGGGGCV